MSMKDKLSFKEAKNIFIKRSFYCCILALLLCWVMKLFGFDYFELDLDNKFFNDLNNFLNKYYLLKQLYFCITLYVNTYLIVSIVNNKDSNKKNALYTLYTMPISVGVRTLTSIFCNKLGIFASFIEFIYMIIITSKFKLKNILKAIIINILSIIYQLISINTRSLKIKSHTLGFIASQILNIDYYIMLYLHKEVESMNDGTWFFFGFTAWLYYVAGFIVGIFKLHPIKNAREWYAKGKEKENARKAKRELKKAQRK